VRSREAAKNFCALQLASLLRSAGAMLRIAGLSTFILATGCMVSSPGGVDPTPMDMLGRVCTTDLTTMGSFVQSTPPPAHEDGTPYTGCWPLGTWTFSAAIVAGDNCENQPAPLAQYQFKVEEKMDPMGDAYQETTYLTDPGIRYRGKISQGGDGLCEGELDLFSADGKEVWILKPELYSDNHLGGSGEFHRYKDDQWLEGS